MSGAAPQLGRGGRSALLARTHGPLAIVLVGVAALAVAMHRDGVSWGDDYTLYVRQATSLVDGNVGQVVADNRFNVDNAAEPAFSPYVYPWGWPALLAPFVRLWGVDWARLKLVEIVCLCGFLAVFYSVVRRRTTQWVALGVVAAIGTTVAYLQHTDKLLAEFPYMLAVAATLWWLDRCRRGHPLEAATRNELMVAGLLVMLVFNIRREGVAMVPAIAAIQLVESRGRWRRIDWRAMATPHVTFVVSVVLLQLMLPSVLAPRYHGAGLGETWTKLGDPFRLAFSRQLGFDRLAGIGLLLVFALVVAGVVVRLVRAAADDVALVVFAVLSMLIVGMHPVMADRYLLAITPFAIYFGAQALAAVPLPRGLGPSLAAGALAVLVLFHVMKLPDPIRDVQRANDTGIVQDGPESAYAREAFAAVERLTHESDVVAFFKARSMTFFTGRRAVQSSVLRVVRERADFFLMRRNNSFSQASVTDEEADAMGWTDVWRSDEWVLWRLPRLA